MFRNNQLNSNLSLIDVGPLAIPVSRGSGASSIDII
jgi:hypothetical protein